MPRRAGAHSATWLGVRLNSWRSNELRRGLSELWERPHDRVGETSPGREGQRSRMAAESDTADRAWPHPRPLPALRLRARELARARFAGGDREVRGGRKTHRAGHRALS